MKSPGNDGFTTVMSFNEIYSEQQIFSISQRQGIITCIRNEGKSKYSLNNWRPITLLNIDLKICLATISKIDCSKPSFGRFLFCIKLSFCSWIKTFYNDSSCSDYFKLGRVVRQSVPLCCLFLVTSFISTGSN